MPKENGKPGDCLPIFTTARVQSSEDELLDKIVEAVEAAEPDGIKRRDLTKQLKDDPFFDGDRASELIKLAEERGLIVEKQVKPKGRFLFLAPTA